MADIPIAVELIERLASFGDLPALGGSWGVVSYARVHDEVREIRQRLDDTRLATGDRVIVLGDHGPSSAAALLELARRRVVAIPLTPAAMAGRGSQLEALSHAQFILRTASSAGPMSVQLEALPAAAGRAPEPELLALLRREGRAGLILFTSGSSGAPKVVVHDVSPLLEKFRNPGRPLRTVNVLLFDHWGGLNTLFRVLASGGFAACPESRRADDVCALIERFSLELLPASPSFLNMLLISGAVSRYDLSSLRTVTYGAEPMPPPLLARLVERFPTVRFRQTYGLVELGVMETRSKADGSLMMRLGGDGYEHRVVDGLLEIRARSSMLGYLNAPSAFTEDGFFRTGDRVEQDGDYIRVLGRDSDIINVGGEKVFPTEVEAVVLEVPGVDDVVVYGEAHPLLGQIVCADVVLGSGLTADDARRVIRRFSSGRLAAFQVPSRVNCVAGPLVNDRQKRMRPRPQNTRALDGGPGDAAQG